MGNTAPRRSLFSVITGLWDTILSVGASPDLTYIERVRLQAFNGFLAIIAVVDVLFILIFVGLNAYSALEGLAVLPIILFGFYLNHKRQHLVARTLFTYGLLIVVLLLAISDRRTGTEYVLIALGCCSVIVYGKMNAIIPAFLFSFVCYLVYVWYDTTHEFVPDPSVPYLLTENSLMFISAFIVVAQSLVFRSLINRYAHELKEANDEINAINEELKSSNEELQSLTDNLDAKVKQKSADLQAYQDAIDINLFSVITDWQGNYLRINDQFLKATGYREEQLIGHSLHTLGDDDAAETKAADLFAHVYQGKSWRSEVRVKSLVGPSFWMDCVVIPVTGKDVVKPYLLILGFSIDERKGLEERNRKAMDTLESIAFRTSHDIRGPLSRIMGLTNLLEKNYVNNEEVADVAKKLLTSSVELNKATSALTEFINAEGAGKDIR